MDTNAFVFQWCTATCAWCKGTNCHGIAAWPLCKPHPTPLFFGPICGRPSRHQSFERLIRRPRQAQVAQSCHNSSKTEQAEAQTFIENQCGLHSPFAPANQTKPSPHHGTTTECHVGRFFSTSMSGVQAPPRPRSLERGKGPEM